MKYEKMIKEFKAVQREWRHNAKRMGRLFHGPSWTDGVVYGLGLGLVILRKHNLAYRKTMGLK